MSVTSIPSLVPPDPVSYRTNLLQSVELVKKVLSVQSESVLHVFKQYNYSEWSISQLQSSLRIMNDSLLSQNKIVVTGIGKSFKIASKVVATLNSLSLHSSILHPSDALHGDLGLIRDGDVLILISASGSSQELIDLLTHLEPSKIKILLLTCNPNSTLANHSKVSSLIYAELPSKFKEENIYGLNAPTISTTLLLTLMDGVAIALSHLYITDSGLRKKLFGERHPGGAIGQAYSSSSSEEASLVDFKIRNIDVNQDYDKHDLEKAANSSTELDLGIFEALKDTSKRIKYLEAFPETQQELFEVAVLFDIVVLNQDKAIATAELISLIRQYQGFNDIKELEWRLLEHFKKIRL